MTRINPPPPPKTPPELSKPQAKATEEPKRSAQTAATVQKAAAQTEALAQRVRGGKAVGAASLLTAHADDTDPLAEEVKQGLVSGRWAIEGLLDHEGGHRGDQKPEEGDVPEIPLEDVPKDVITSPLGRAYRTVRWMKALMQAEAAAALLANERKPLATPQLLAVIEGLRSHQNKRRAVTQAEAFLRAERARIRSALNQERARALASGNTFDPDTRRFGLPSVTLTSPPAFQPADLALTPADAPFSTGDALGGGSGTLLDLELLLDRCGDLKNQLIDETAVHEAEWTALLARTPELASAL